MNKSIWKFSKQIVRLARSYGHKLMFTFRSKQSQRLGERKSRWKFTTQDNFIGPFHCPWAEIHKYHKQWWKMFKLVSLVKPRLGLKTMLKSVTYASCCAGRELLTWLGLRWLDHQSIYHWITLGKRYNLERIGWFWLKTCCRSYDIVFIFDLE